MTEHLIKLYMSQLTKSYLNLAIELRKRVKELETMRAEAKKTYDMLTGAINEDNELIEKLETYQESPIKKKD